MYNTKPTKNQSNRYYKATTPEGTSFYDETTKWDVGKVISVPVKETKQLLPSDLPHTIDDPGETLSKCDWPCGLFIVDGQSVFREGHQHGFFELKVIEEIEAWRSLGENGKEVEETLNSIQEKVLAIKNSISNPEWKAAWNEVKRLHEADNRQAICRRILDTYKEIKHWGTPWIAAHCTAMDIALSATLGVDEDSARDDDWKELWDNVWYTVYSTASEATGAYIARNLIPKDQFDLLVAPWELLTTKTQVQE